MEDLYQTRYSEVHNTFNNRRSLTIELLLKDLLIVEECIGFQFWLSDQIANLAKAYPDKWANLQKQIAHELYNRNIHYLYSSLELSLPGLCDPSYNNLRTVHESVLKMYYLWAFPEEAENINESMEPGKKSKYGHEYMIQRLYAKDLQDSMRCQFREMSVKSHSNYTGTGSTLEYSKDQVKDCLWFIQLMSFYNVCAEIENQAAKPTILEPIQGDKVGEFLKKLRAILADSQGNMATYFPDHPLIQKKLSIRPDIS